MYRDMKIIVLHVYVYLPNLSREFTIVPRLLTQNLVSFRVFCVYSKSVKVSRQS